MDYCLPAVMVLVAVVSTITVCAAIGAAMSRRRTETAVLVTDHDEPICVPANSEECWRHRMLWLDQMARTANRNGAMLMVGPDDRDGWSPAREVELNVEAWPYQTEIVQLDDIRIRRRKGNGNR